MPKVQHVFGKTKKTTRTNLQADKTVKHLTFNILKNALKTFTRTFHFLFLKNLSRKYLNHLAEECLNALLTGFLP